MFKLVSAKYSEADKTGKGASLVLAIHDDRDDTTEEIDASVVFTLAKSGVQFEGIRLSEDRGKTYISALIVTDDKIIDHRYYENGEVSIYTEYRGSSNGSEVEVKANEKSDNEPKDNEAEEETDAVEVSSMCHSTPNAEDISVRAEEVQYVKEDIATTAELVKSEKVHDNRAVSGSKALGAKKSELRSASDKKAKKSNDCGGAKAMTLSAISILKGAGAVMKVEDTETGEVEEFDFREIRKSPQSVILGGVCNTVDFASSDFTYFVGSAFSVALAEGVSWDFKLKDAMLQAVDAITKVKGTDGKAVRLYARCCGRSVDSIKAVEPFSEELGVAGQRYRVWFIMKA